jgi:biotin-(acetyl-CoA carboxylase) ligase
MLLARFERAYDAWREQGLDGIYGELGARDFLRGRRITVDGESATAVLIGRDGRLEIQTDGHESRFVESGEVRFER